MNDKWMFEDLHLPLACRVSMSLEKLGQDVLIDKLFLLYNSNIQEYWSSASSQLQLDGRTNLCRVKHRAWSLETDLYCINSKQPITFN